MRKQIPANADFSMMLTLPQLDKLITNKLESISDAAIAGKNENMKHLDDLERFQILLHHPRSKKVPKMIGHIIKTTKSDLVIKNAFSLIIDILSGPNEFADRLENDQSSHKSSATLNLVGVEKSSDTISVFSSYLELIPVAFPHFILDQQDQLLETIALTLTQLTPNASKSQPQLSFNIYISLTKVCLEIFSTYSKPDSPKKLLLNFAKQVLGQAITVASMLSEYSKKSKIQISSYAGYIGELLPFVASIEKASADIDIELSKLLQQFWICCVIFASSNINLFFSQWEGALNVIAHFFPSLIHGQTRGDFATVKFRVQELLNLIQPVSMTKVQDVIPIFTRHIPTINIKILQEMELPDAVYALSLFSLEKLRAHKGIISPFFKYFEVEYTANFSAILDAMVDPLFSKFNKAIESFEDPDEGRRCANAAMVTFVERYTWPVAKVRSIVDTHIKNFVNAHPFVLFDVKVLRALSNSVELMESQTPERQTAFQGIIQDLFTKCITAAPYAFMAILQHLVVDQGREAFYSEQPSFVHTIYNYLTSLQKEQFTTELILKCLLRGEASFVTKEQIRAVQYQSDRLLLTASYAALREDEQILSDLVTTAPQKTLFIAWSHCVMNGSRKIAGAMSRLLITKFAETIRTRTGIFGDKLDMVTIELQKSILLFFIEQAMIGRDLSSATPALAHAFEVPILNHPASIIVVLPLAQLTCFLGTSVDNKLALRSIEGFRIFFFKLVLRSYYFSSNQLVYKYISEDEVKTLENLIEIMDQQSQRISQGPKQEVSLRSSQGSLYGTEMTRKECILAVQRATTNFASRGVTDNKLALRLTSVITFMICSELQTFLSYLNITPSPATQRLLALHQLKPQSIHLSSTVPVLYNEDPAAIYTFAALPQIENLMSPILLKIIKNTMFHAATVPEMSLFLAKQQAFDKSNFLFWSPLKPVQALSLLVPEIMNDKRSASYVARCFEQFTRDESLMFIPQLVQSLRFDTHGVMQKFLMKFSESEEVFSHYLLWNILAEKNNHVTENDNLPQILTQLETKIIDHMTPQQRTLYEAEFKFIDDLDLVSQHLLPLEIPNRPSALFDKLKDMNIPEGLYIPSNPNYKIISIDAENSVPLKSHARVPILVKFKVYDDRDEEKKPIPFACIFKIHDDVRQDAMMYQFIEVFKGIFRDAGIDCFVYPYRVFATGENRGVIELIPKSKSRHDIGSATNEDLLHYFISKYGQIGTAAFNKAQENFVRSMAPNSLICYLFQVKDRHNANIMIDEDGHVIHIDFGFIFEISPGGNMKFERAPFKLSKEMIDLMGGSKEAAPFKLFRKLLIQCMFAARARHEEIEAITNLMRSAGFPCFRADSIKKLRERFCFGMTPKEVVQTVDSLIAGSYEAITTTGYDAFQASQNKIYF
ncbi:Phosphatidylinositol 3- and 4-kinase family protein [Trichomonas vaginalis G3]|uniref:1-phosphatidylinositol 4-kinase n=1 Tax=Trichomonas vaginalis (strain ATCC PRA-98 / G3) TaxID=412133 RepID=A2F7A3_TRIV3|nr:PHOSPHATIDYLINOSITOL KINASE family [Trichomonas vaginalis G3]EAX99218.1 Phosphatidylinositol 3- and 4-kinase family protein [Trichomonas vaginalis G3]KAI5538730.1 PHOSPHATIDYLINOSITOL KINASE family [Trichomonas vaginalis G3]|eukprot:XP_001312148.1 Phosphatidylinositol 3- and 4-kinase family protein [Trichomonas vaginalis G3]